MLFKSSVLLALASAVIAAPSIDIRDEKPDPSQVTIKGITTSGSGCPQGSVGKFLSSDRQTSVPQFPLNSLIKSTLN